MHIIIGKVNWVSNELQGNLYLTMYVYRRQRKIRLTPPLFIDLCFLEEHYSVSIDLTSHAFSFFRR